MALTPGTRFGAYEITAAIGKGGMGVVYRARDTKLDRDVAIKVLPEAFAQDADRLARFQREAKTLASLNHPHIAAIYGLQESNGVRALVMELVEGDDLSQRIVRGAIPLDEALPIAKQIAEALEAAHEQGIIHRDLKPANIKVRPDGTVKVLDFGLAKAIEPAAGSSPSVSLSPTITSPAMTQAGMILGTAAYMSPEQARGKNVDRRSDIWAFGAVLFEMLTGNRAFPGEDLTETLAAVVRGEPDWGKLPPGLSLAVVVYIKRCLHKDPKQRIPDIAAMRLALEGAFEPGAPQTTATPSTRRERMAWITALAAAAVVIIALAIPAARYLRETPPPAPPETRVDILTPASQRSGDFALSPDGRQIVFVASGDGVSRLWLRSLATTTAQPLAGTDGGTFPFWAPDGRSVGFFAGGALKRLDLGGGAPQTLVSAINGNGGTWNANGVIVFAPSANTTPLMRVSATGGAPAAVTTLGPKQQGHHSPFFLPDRNRFLFFVAGTPDTSGIYLGALDGSAPTRLTPAGRATAAFLAGPGRAEALREDGWLLWVRAGTRTLVAQRLDLARAALTGGSVTLADEVAAVAVAATGLVAYRGSGSSLRQLTWVDRSGTERGSVGDPDATIAFPRLSNDGRRVVVTRTMQGNQDLWLVHGARMSRFTFDAAVDSNAVWSPDGTRIVFMSNRTGSYDLYQKLTSGAGVEDRLVVSDQFKVPTNWSADGRFLLYFSNDPQTDSDLWVVPMALREPQGHLDDGRAMGGDRTPLVVLKTPFREIYGVFSRDGRWVSYQSNESGRNEVYVRRFVPPGAAGMAGAMIGGQVQVSTAGGIHPVWRRDGKELYYVNPAGAMMAVSITVSGSTLEPGPPVALFPTRVLRGGVDAQQGRQYDVAPDGRFLINTELDSGAAPITLIQNWQPEAKN